MAKLDALFARFPYMEVAVRRVYSKVRDMRLVKHFLKHFLDKQTVASDRADVTCTKEQLLRHLEDFGIQKGDILIVHSSMESLGKAGMNAKEAIDMLLELVGETGTLVMPAFPQFTKKEIIDGEEVDVYDVKRTLAWTGMLPNMFLRYKGVVRSEWPCNPLAAKGPQAEEMMRDNLKAPVSQGRGTAWGYCMEHHAKVLFLGVRPFHSISESHIAEDYLLEEWPIDNWYIDQKYLIKNGGEQYLVTLKKRNPCWASYVTEFYSAKQMRRLGILAEEVFCGIPLGFISDLKDFNEKRMCGIHNGWIGYRIPKKYWKRSKKQVTR